MHSLFSKHSSFNFFFICLLTLNILGCSENSTGPSQNNENTTPGNKVPEQLAGSWTAGNVSSVNFFNPGTGSWAPPSGVGVFYKFTGDGYCEKGVLLQSSLYGCTMTVHAFQKGTAAVEGNKITFYPTYGRIKSEDNCVQENNYEKPDELTNEIIFWELGVDEYGDETLWLNYENGTPTAFHRE
jgi:hypothetical protein